MSRTGFAVLSLGVLLSLLLLASAGSLAHVGDTFAALLTPVLIILAGTAIGVVVALRARATHLSGLWGFLAMILTVEALALINPAHLPLLKMAIEARGRAVAAVAGGQP